MPIRNRHNNNATLITSPVTGAVTVTPSDVNDLPEITLSLYVSTAGAAKLTLYDNTTVTYANLSAGRHPLRVRRVWATGTMATGIVAEF